jgi:hypothetical protein
LVPIQRQMTRTHSTISYVSKTHFNIILSPTSTPSLWSLSFWPPQQTPLRIHFLSHACYILCHVILLDLIILILLGEEYKLCSSSLCNFLHSPATSFLLGPHILLNTLFSNTFSPYSSLNIRYQVLQYIKGQPKLYFFFIFQSLGFWGADMKKKISGLNGSKHYPNSFCS